VGDGDGLGGNGAGDYESGKIDTPEGSVTKKPRQDESVANTLSGGNANSNSNFDPGPSLGQAAKESRPRLARSVALPGDAQRLQAPLERALKAVEASVRAAAAAVEDADLNALAEARARVTQLWTQTQLALAAFEKAAAGASATAAQRAALDGSTGRGASGLPVGWGDRNVALSEAELLVRGNIVPLPGRQAGGTDEA